MDSSSERGTKLDFSNENIPPSLIKTVSDPVIENKKAETTTRIIVRYCRNRKF
jgi:hypothetical protein